MTAEWIILNAEVHGIKTQITGFFLILNIYVEICPTSHCSGDGLLASAIIVKRVDSMLVRLPLRYYGIY